jgi:hypothetical protein
MTRTASQTRQSLLQRTHRLWFEVRLVAGERLRYAPLILALILVSWALDLVGVALMAPFIALLLGDDSLLAWLPSFLRGMLGDDPIGRLSVLLVGLFVGKAAAAIWVQWSITTADGVDPRLARAARRSTFAASWARRRSAQFAGAIAAPGTGVRATRSRACPCGAMRLCRSIVQPALPPRCSTRFGPRAPASTR